MGKPSGKKKLKAAAEKATKQNKASGSDRASTQINDANGYENMKVEEVNRSKNMEKAKDNKVNRGKHKRTDKKVAMADDKKIVKEEKVITKAAKLVFGDDIRWAKLPLDCSIGFVRQIIRDRFPSLHGVLIKYKDREGDLITIITTPELRSAEASSDPQGTFKLYLVEVTPDKEPSYELFQNEQLPVPSEGKSEEGNTNSKEEWIVQFSRLFKNHVGFDTDPYLDLHELGMEIYSEAMEDSTTTESSQNLFDIAGSKFQEMSALALFNLGNVHMNKARKSILISNDEDTTKESVSEKVKIGFEFSQTEYQKAGERYEQSTQVKPDFYEGHLALGQQQFEEAKLSWCYLLGSKPDSLNSNSSSKIMELYNKAEENMERGIQMWEELEERRLNGVSLCEEHKAELVKLGMEGVIDVKEGCNDEELEEAVNIRSQIYILWGTLLYERSVVEWKMCLGSWEECLEASIEKFELAGASPTDITVIIKNHCSNGTALEGLSFKIDEIVQAWNEMFDTKRWLTGIPSFPLEPLFRRRVPKLHSLLENF